MLPDAWTPCQDLPSHSDAPVTDFGGCRGSGTAQSVVAEAFFSSFLSSCQASLSWAQVQTVLVSPQRYSTCLLGCTHPCCPPPVWRYKATHTDHCTDIHTHSALNKTRPYHSANLAPEPPRLKGSILRSSPSGPGHVSAPGPHACQGMWDSISVCCIWTLFSRLSISIPVVKLRAKNQADRL